MSLLPDLPLPRVRPHGRFDLAEAAEWQRAMRARVEHADRLGPVRRIAGADVAYAREGDRLHAAVVVLDADTLEVLETASVEQGVACPYVPGFLTLREAPGVLAAFARLSSGRGGVDLLLVDAHGVAHPRRFGLACHLGLALDLPTIGVAKSLLVGAPDPLDAAKGAAAPLWHGDEVVGAAVRTRTGISPVYVSVGHRVSLPTAVELALRAVRRFRVPEPTRQAHLAVGRQRRAAS